MRHVVSVPTLADLRTFKGEPDSVILLLGKNTVGDGLGGTYRWYSGLGGSDSPSTMETLMVTNVVNGYWKKVHFS